MPTFIMHWRPSVSENTPGMLREAIRDLEFGEIRWRTDTLTGRARGGDEVCLLCLEGTPHVVMTGFLLEDPSGDSVLIKPTFIALPGDGERRLGDSLGLDAYGDGDLLPDFTAKQLIHDRETYIRECGESFFDGVRADHTRRPEATVDDAILIAAEVFSDEVDPADGRPAILSHLSQLYKRGTDICNPATRSPYRYETNRYTICAILRDVIGKKGWTGAKLRACGFPENVVTPLSILSRREGERTRAYITRIGLSGCKCAIRIKSDELEDRKRIDPERKEYYHEQLVCLHKAARDDYEF